VGRVRVSRVIRARIGYFLGILLVACGMYFALGLGWALVAAGLGTSAAFVWLYDVSEAPDPTATREGEWM
jgi:CBS-domain-containing membrane protein